VSIPKGIGSAIRARIDALADISAEPGRLTRVYLSPEHRRANALVMEWMRAAGMSAREDAAGNVIGRREGARPGLPALMLGSHLDSVRDAGRWDGPLGVVTAIACVETLRDKSPPFAIEVIGFADEEGTRFGATMLGSRAVAGTFDRAALGLRDADGVSMAEAMLAWGLDPDGIDAAARRREEMLAYLELHIEQGPVLEREDLPVGCVTAIAGATRLSVALEGEAGHAGTVPMQGRRDALTAAAECVLGVEALARTEAGTVATVGRIVAEPGAVNVIPGRVTFTVDLRAPEDAVRARLLESVRGRIGAICAARGVRAEIVMTHTLDAAPCAPWLRAQIEAAIAAECYPVRALPSGAGHDGMAMATIADIGMIFVRCRGGISHHPDEHADEADIEAAARVLLRVIENFSPPESQS
jgi:allantoate deiminase